MVARLLATAALSLGSNPDICQKYKMGDISKGVANTFYPAKKYTKNENTSFFSIHEVDS
jgi:hypothetical protein